MRRPIDARLRTQGRARLRLSALLGVALAAAVLVLPSAVGAGRAVPVLRASFVGTLLAHSFSYGANSTCANFSVPSLPRFNLSTGTGNGAGAANASGCRTNATTGNSAYVQEGLELTSAPVNATTNGTLSLRASWIVTFTASFAVTFVRSTSVGFATYYLDTYCIAVDLTSHRGAVGTSKILGGGSVSYTNSSHTAQYTNRSFVGVTMATTLGHTYQFTAVLLVDVSAGVNPPGGAHARVSVNWGTAGNDAKLLTFVVS